MLSNQVIIGCIVTAIALAVALYFLMKKDTPKVSWTDAQKKEIRDYLNSIKDPLMTPIILAHIDCIIDYVTANFSYDDYKNKKQEVMKSMMMHSDCFGKKGSWDPMLKAFIISMMSAELQEPCPTCVVNQLEKDISPNLFFPPGNDAFKQEVEKALLNCLKECTKH